MVHLTKIYTKTGDKGMTSIANNERVEKFSPLIVAIGSIDETNSAIGMCGIKSDVIDKIQNDLFDLGADIAGFSTVKIDHKHVTWLEKQIDEINASLEPLHSFVLPTGPLHNARTIARRAERDVWYLIEIQDLLEVKVNKLAATYLNRLSDLLFVMARYYNKGNEKLWVPLENH